MVENEEYIRSRIAPCSLHCGKCFAFKGGDVAEMSRKLKEALGNFAPYAHRFVELLDQPEFKHYPAFEKMLDLFSRPTCRGCRVESCNLFKDCKVRDCAKERHVDFCYQCAEFPCGSTGFDEHLQKRSVEINRQIREYGLEHYFNEIKDRSRY